MVDIEGTCDITGQRCVKPCDAKNDSEDDLRQAKTPQGMDFVVADQSAQGVFGKSAVTRGIQQATAILANRIQQEVRVNPTKFARYP